MSRWNSTLTFSDDPYITDPDLPGPLPYVDWRPPSTFAFLDIASIPAGTPDDRDLVEPQLRLIIRDTDDGETAVVLDPDHVDALIRELTNLRARFTKETP